jgi:hypothetical protein
MERKEFQTTIEKFQGLFNPYNCKVGDIEAARVSIDIPKADHQLLKQITIDNGFFQRALSMYIYVLADYCRQRDLMFYSPLNAQELYDFIRSRCTLVDVTDSGHSENDHGPVTAAPTKTPKRRKQRAKSTRSNRTKDSQGESE